MIKLLYMPNPEFNNKLQHPQYTPYTDAEKQHIRDLYRQKMEQKNELPKEHYSFSFELEPTENLEVTKEMMFDHLSGNLHAIADALYDPLTKFELLRVSEHGTTVEYEIIIEGKQIEMDEENGIEMNFQEYINKTINNQGSAVNNIAISKS